MRAKASWRGSLLLCAWVWVAMASGEMDGYSDDEDGLDCGDLEPQLCAYSVSSSGYRCMPDMDFDEDGNMHHICSAYTDIEAGDQFCNWIETDECMSTCGLNRMSMTIADVYKLCSYECLTQCPNIADFYSSIGDGLLDDACKNDDVVIGAAESLETIPTSPDLP